MNKRKFFTSTAEALTGSAIITPSDIIRDVFSPKEDGLALKIGNQTLAECVPLSVPEEDAPRNYGEGYIYLNNRAVAKIKVTEIAPDNPVYIIYYPDPSDPPFTPTALSVRGRLQEIRHVFDYVEAFTSMLELRFNFRGSILRLEGILVVLDTKKVNEYTDFVLQINGPIEKFKP